MAVFRVERNTGYTVMSNHHLRNKELSLKAKGLLSQMLSLPEDWDYTLAGLSHINRESIDAIRTAVWELEKAGYILRRQGRDEKGKMTAIEYTIYEQPQPMLENPIPGSRTFEVIGHSVCIDDETLAEAISALPVDRRDIILLSYFLDMSDAEIANALNMVRRSVAYRRTSTLKLLKNLMGGENR